MHINDDINRNVFHIDSSTVFQPTQRRKMKQIIAEKSRKTYKRINITSENFEIIQPLLTTARIFGLCPVYYAKTGSSYVLQWSILYAGYSYLIIISASCLAIFGFLNDINMDEASHRMKDRKSKIVAACDISIVIIIAIFCIAGTPCRMRVFWKLLCCCNRIDCAIPLTNPSRYRVNSAIFIGIVLILFTSVEIFDIIVWSDTSKHGRLGYLADYCGFYFLYYIIVVQELFFWHLIFFLEIRISLLNEFLLLEEDQGKELRNLNLVNVYLDNLNLYKKSSKRGPVFKKKAFLGGIATANLGFIERISTLAKLHKYVSNTVDSINNSVANGIVLLTLSCLDHLIVTPYFFVKEMTSDNPTGVVLCLQVSWFATHIFLLLIMVEPCHICLKESRRTLHLACKLLAQFNMDEEDRRVLEIFIIQLAQKKIRFSCFGLFQITRSIITKLAGAVTTYLVILFQLNN
nr:gustatory receptor [Semanotus bifasciatus]